nr:reverse transcriptase domain-containing protein [Tanacetum cinerariifolium]
NIFPPLDNPELTIQRRSHTDPTLLNDFEMATEGNGDLPTPDLRTMEELCQPSLNGQGGPIAPIAIQAMNFGLKNDMIQQVHNSCQFHGLSGDDANKHLDKFLHVTQSIKVNGVTDDAFNLYLFPHSLTHHATAWFDRLPRNSINTFEQMAKMFLGKYFPPSMVTKLRNEITNFCQRLDESLFEAWERGTFMKRHLEECYDLIENMTAHHNDWDTSAQQSESSSSITSSSDTEFAAPKAEMAEINKNLMRVLQEDLKRITTRSGTAYQGPTIPTTTSSLPPVVERETEATKDTVHPPNNGSTKDVQPPVIQTESLILNSNLVVTPIIEPVASLVSAPKPNQRLSIPYPSRLQDQKLCDKANDQREKFFQIFKDLNFIISFADALILMPKFIPTIKTLLTNKDKLSELARTPLNEHCSTVLLKKFPEKLGDPGKFLISCDFLGMAECLALVDLGASINLMPLSVWNKLSIPDLSPTCMTLDLIDLLISRLVGVAEDLYRSFLKTRRALINVFVGELTRRAGKESITFNLDQTSIYSADYNDLTTNRIDIIDMACEEYSQEVLGFSDVITSGNFTPYYDLIVSTTSSTLTPLRNSDFLLKECKLLAVASLFFWQWQQSSLAVGTYTASENSNLATESLILNFEPVVAPIIKPVAAPGIDPEFCTHKILMEDEFEPAVQHQRRVNPKIHDVIKNDVLKLLDAGLIYPISDSPWVSLVQCVPKKGSFTVVENEENELIPTRLVTGWRVCIDYRKLNEATCKDHFPLPFMDQMLKRLARNEYYYFLDGFLGYFQIPIDPKDQEKTTFTCL